MCQDLSNDTAQKLPIKLCFLFHNRYFIDEFSRVWILSFERKSCNTAIKEIPTPLAKKFHWALIWLKSIHKDAKN